MPGRMDSALYESGRATAPPVVRYTPTDTGQLNLAGLSFPGNPPEGYIHTSATSGGATLAEQVAQSPRYTPRYTSTPCPSPGYPSAIPKPTPSPSPSLPSQSPQYAPSYSASPHLYSPSFAPATPSYPGFNAPSTSYGTPPAANSGNTALFPTSDHIASTLFSIPSSKSAKTPASPRYTPNYSNFSYFSTSQKQPEPFPEAPKQQKSSKTFEFTKPRRSAKDDSDVSNYNIGDFQQFLSKHSSKIKNSAESVSDSVTDSLLSFLQRKSFPSDKTFGDGFVEDCIDNQVVVSVCNKSKDSEGKKKDGEKAADEDEEKKCKTAEDRRKSCVRKDGAEDSELEDKGGKRDAAMSHHYQEEKGHHKRAAGYGDFNQWEYLNAHDGQASGGHGRRSHLPFCGTSQSHAMAWNPMGMVPHQGNPYYSTPHMDRGHMVPAHAHASDYRYNQWSNPGHKLQRDINLHSAHQNQTKAPAHQDVSKHHAAGPKALASQDYGLPLGTEFTKIRNAAHDLARPPADMGLRTAQEYPPSVSPSMRNPAGHPKSIVADPLSDLQLLVTSQDAEKPAKKTESYQQESVDLSAHAEAARLKDCGELGDKASATTNTVIARVAKDESKPAEEVADNPVELTAKTAKCKDIAEKEISSTHCEEAAQEASDGKSAPASVIVGSPEKPPEGSEEPSGKQGEAEERTPVEKKEGDVEDAVLSEGGEAAASSSLEDKATAKRKAGEGPDQPDSKRVFVQVETELEKMFEEGKGDAEAMEAVDTAEGADKGDAESLPTVSSTSADVKPSPAGGAKKKPPRKRPPRASRSNRSSSSETQASKKKGKSGAGKGRAGRDAGPVLHVEGSRECPLTVAVVNYPKNEDDDERKALSAALSRSKTQPEYRGRQRKGLFSSTLSARYDAHTTDQTWICVLCKRGPHYRCLGDLYGPYIVSRDSHAHAHTACDFSGDEKDIADAQKRGGRKKSIRANNMVEHFQKMSKKLRRLQPQAHSAVVGMAGMAGMRAVCVEEDPSDLARYEMWLHEQCIVWTTGICLIGSRLHGLDEAIWPSIQTMCSKCGEMGASLGCVYRNCGNRSHYVCAVESGWCLEQDTFIATCHVHRRRS